MRCSRLKALAVLGCCLQIVITVGLPLFQYFMLFQAAKAFMYILIVTGSGALLAGLLGIGSAVSSGTVLPALHAVVSITLAALLGGFNTQLYMDFQTKCSLSQAVVSGCSSCPCAITSTCTVEDLSTLASCAGCKALGTDFCTLSSNHTLLLPYTGLIEAVLLALPAVFSLLSLVNPARPQLPVDCEIGGHRAHFRDGRFAVTAWAQDERTAVQEDWPMTTATPIITGEAAGFKQGL